MSNIPVAEVVPIDEPKTSIVAVVVKWVKVGTWAFCAFQIFVITVITLAADGKSGNAFQSVYNGIMGLFGIVGTMAWWTAVNKGIDEIFRK